MNRRRRKFCIQILLLILSLADGYAQSNWLNTAGGRANDEGLCVAASRTGRTYSGGYFSLQNSFGSSLLLSAGSSDGFIACTDSAGNYLWALRCGGLLPDRVTAVTCDDSGYVYIAGTFSGNGTLGSFQLQSADTMQQLFVARLDSTGTINWVYQSTGNDQVLGYSIGVDDVGNVSVTGQFRGQVTFGSSTVTSEINPAGDPSYDIFILHISHSGNVLWSKTGKGTYDDNASTIYVDATGMIYIAGQFSDTITFDQQHNYVVYNAGFIAKFDDAGNEQWFRPLFGFQVTVRSVIGNADSVWLAGNYKGVLQYNGSALPSSTKNYNYFIIGLDSSGNRHSSATNGSDDPLDLMSAAVTGNSVYIAGTFQCNMQSFSGADSGLFNGIGYRDVFVSRYSKGCSFIDAKQFGGSGDDNVYEIVSHLNEPLLTGSFERNFNVPDGGNFISNNAVYDSSLYGPVQPAVYCNDQNYNRYISIGSKGFKDILLAKPYDDMRSDYDYYDRSGLNCMRPALSPHLLPDVDSVSICDTLVLRILTHTGTNGVVGPAYHYLWSDGSEADTLAVYQTGWYSLVIETADKCRGWKDSVYIKVYQLPAAPQLHQSGGIMHTAIPDMCGKTVVYMDTAVVNLWCSNVPAGYQVYWDTPSGQVYNDSVSVSLQGIYSCMISTPDGSCTRGDCMELVAFTIVDEGNFDAYNPLIYFMVDSVYIQTDTVKVCEGDYFNVLLHDSLLQSLGLYDSIPLFVKWEINGGFHFEYPYSYDYTFWYHHELFPADSSGNCSITISFHNPVNDSSLLSLTKNFILIVNPLPADSAVLSGPAYFCPGDTVLLTLTPYRQSVFEGPGIVSVVPDSGILADLPGLYTATYTITDSVTGCSQEFVRKFNLQSLPQPHVTLFPSNGIVCPGDSVELTAETGTGYQWSGPLMSADSVQSFYTSTAGYYSYSFIDTGGCNLVSEAVEVMLYSSPFLTADPAPVLCQGSSITLNVQTNDPGAINWLPPLSGNMITQTINSPGTYSCIVSSCGINDTLKIIISASDVAADILAGDSIIICPGRMFSVQANSGMAYYSWSDGTTSSSINIVTAGTYILNTQDFYGCSASDTIVVDTFPRPAAPVVSDEIICAGAQVTLTATASGAVSWFNNLIDTVPVASGNNLTVDSVLNNITYYAASYDGRCYSTYSAVDIIVNPVSLPPLISGDVTVCDHDVLMLAAPLFQQSQYIWSGPGNFTSTADTIIIQQATSALNGYYVLQASDSQCSGPPDSVLVTVFNPVNVIIVPGDTSACNGSTVQLSAAPALLQYLWHPVNATTAVIDVVSSGTYFLSGTDTNGCAVTTDSAHVTFGQSPQPPVITGNLTVCPGEPFNLSILPDSGIAYMWNGPGGFTFSGPSLILTPALPAYQPGVYSVVLTNGYGCTQTAAVNLNIRNVKASLANDTSVCNGDSFTTAAVVNATAVCNWITPRGSVSGNQIFIAQAVISDSGYYSIQVNDSGCVLTDSMHVSVIIPEQFSLGDDKTACSGIDITLSVEDIYSSYHWNTGSEDNLIHTDTSGIYLCTAVFGPGCIVTDSVELTFIDCSFTIPNVFTPDNDGINDLFYIPFADAAGGNLHIRNRWGSRIADISGLVPQWDGRDSMGLPVPEGTYFWTADIIDVFGKSFAFQGTVTLIR